MTSRHLRRWLVGAVLFVAIATIGIGRVASRSSLLREAGASASAPGASAAQSADAFVPSLQAAKLSVAERAGVKLPGLAMIMAAAAAAPAVPRLRFRRSHGLALSPALRRLAVPRRGPPALSLA